MIRTLSSVEPYCDFIRSFSNDPVFSDPMLVTEAQRQKHLYEVPADPCACLLGSFAGETLTGLFVFLILEKDRYVQMLAGLTRSRKACAEALDFLTSRCAGYGADFVFNPRNAVLRALLKERGCIMDPEQLRLRWTREVPVSDLSGIFPLEEPHRARYCALHSRGVYWTAERVLAAPERFHVLLALDGGEAVGYLDLHCGETEHEIYDLFVAETHRHRGYGKKLLAQAVQISRSHGLIAVLDADSSAALALFSTQGFVPEPGGAMQTARWEIPMAQ